MGPGLMWAGAAVGVSHLIQSTRAGAEFGFVLIGVLIFSNVIKYPFFEFAPRYAASTGQHLVHGYKAVGKWAVVLYGLLTVSTMFVIQAAVTIVTAGIIAKVFGLESGTVQISIGLLLSVILIVAIGRYSVLDGVMKVIILLLTVSTLIAVVSAYNIGYHPQIEFEVVFDWQNPLHLAFLIAFVGWMPAPIDISVWHSFWSYAKQKETGQKIALKDALLDFNIGYIGTAILATGFLSLGAILMYGSGQEFSNNGTVFSGQLIQLYTDSIGTWAYYIIAIAALATMFSTTLTCLDAYSRVLRPTSEYLFPSLKSESNIMKWFWVFLVAIGAVIIISFYVKSMTIMVDIATTISFVTAPVLAYLNYRAVNSSKMPVEFRPAKWLRVYAYLGMIFLTAFSLGFLYWRIVLY